MGGDDGVFGVRMVVIFESNGRFGCVHQDSHECCVDMSLNTLCNHPRNIRHFTATLIRNIKLVYKGL